MEYGLWNQNNAPLGYRYLTDNQVRTSVRYCGEFFSFEFHYGIKVIHQVKIPTEIVLNKYQGDLGSAIAEIEGHEYLVFKQKIREAVAYKEDDNKIASDNTINRLKSE